MMEKGFGLCPGRGTDDESLWLFPLAGTLLTALCFFMFYAAISKPDPARIEQAAEAMTLVDEARPTPLAGKEESWPLVFTSGQYAKLMRRALDKDKAETDKGGADRPLERQFSGFDFSSGKEGLQETAPAEGSGFDFSQASLELRSRRAKRLFGQLRMGLDNESDKAYLTRNKDMVGLYLSAPGIFKPGGAELNRNGTLILELAASGLSAPEDAGGWRISIQGHTDSAPPSDLERFPSNWELSAARAASAARELIRAGVEAGAVQAAGLADTAPLEPEVSQLGQPIPRNKALNNRLTILIKAVEK